MIVPVLAFLAGLFLGSTISMAIVLTFIYYISMKAQKYQKQTADAIQHYATAVSHGPVPGVMG